MRQCNLVTYQTGKTDTGGEPISLDKKDSSGERGGRLWQPQRKLVTGKQAEHDRIFPVEPLRESGNAPNQGEMGKWKTGIGGEAKAATFLGLGAGAGKLRSEPMQLIRRIQRHGSEWGERKGEPFPTGKIQGGRRLGRVARQAGRREGSKGGLKPSLVSKGEP